MIGHFRSFDFDKIQPQSGHRLVEVVYVCASLSLNFTHLGRINGWRKT